MLRDLLKLSWGDRNRPQGIFAFWICICSNEGTMTLDIVWIDAEITRLQKLREIAADPQMMALMERASLKVASSTDSKLDFIHQAA